MEILKIIQVYGITDGNNVSLENNDESKLGNIQDTAGNNGLINEQNTQIQEIIIDDKENNIKDILKERNSTLDTEKQLTWTVENPEIAEIDEKGNILPKTEEILKTMGEQIKLARLRRSLSAELVAERAGISRASLWKVEKGDPSVAMGIYAAVLHALNNLDQDLLLIAKDDELGRQLQDLNLITRKRAPRRSD